MYELPNQLESRLVAATFPYHRPESFTVRFLIAEVNVRQPIPLAVAVGPLEVVHQTPGVEGAHLGAVGNGASEFGKVPLKKAVRRSSGTRPPSLS
jgi:hypothetical protein